MIFLKKILNKPSNKSVILRTFISHNKSSFSTNKDKDEDKSTTINISQQQLNQIKSFVKHHKININDLNNLSSINKEQSSQFFHNQQAKLSFKIMQIDNIELLTPIIRQYEKKNINVIERQDNEVQLNDKLVSLIRCKFIILHKYVNLNGKINHKDIKLIYKDVANNINLLQEVYVYQFYRIIANQIKVYKIDNIDLPSFPIISRPTHTNSQLLSLLIMIYPQVNPKLFQHYQLSIKSKESDENSQNKLQMQMLYDPVHLIHIIKHLSQYKNHYEPLFNKSMNNLNLQQQSYIAQQTIRSNQQLSQRQLQAALFCLNNQLYQQFVHYYFNDMNHLNLLSIKSKITLLKELLINKSQIQKKGQGDTKINLETWVQKILNDIISKENLKDSTNQDEQSDQNVNYKNLIEILTVIYMQHKQYLIHPNLHQLFIDIFTYNSLKWQPTLQSFNTNQLLNILVCYKAYYNYQKDNKLNWISSQNQLISAIFQCFKQQLKNSTKQLSGKQVFYWCYFADEFNMLQKLKSRKVYDVLKKYRNAEGNNDKIKGMIDNILKDFHQLG